MTPETIRETIRLWEEQLALVNATDVSLTMRLTES